MVSTPRRRRLADELLERAAERGFGLVADSLGVRPTDWPSPSRCDASCMRHSARYCIGGWPTISVNRSAKTERDWPTQSRESLNRPWPGRLGVERGEGEADHRISQTGEPTHLRGRQRLDVPADRLDEHQLGKTGENVFSARTARARFPHGDVHDSAEPPARGVGVASGKMNHLWQRRQQRVVRTFLESQEAAHDPRAVLAAAPDFAYERQRGRGRPREQREVRVRRPVPGALDRTCASPCGNRSRSPSRNRIGGSPADPRPARALRDDVVLDDPLGAGHHHPGDVSRRRRVERPRRAQREVEVHRARETHRAQHVGEDVGALWRSSTDEPQGNPDATLMALGRRLTVV